MYSANRNSNVTVKTATAIPPNRIVKNQNIALILTPVVDRDIR